MDTNVGLIKHEQKGVTLYGKQKGLLVPYCGINSIKLKRQLARLINAISPWSKLCVVFKPIYRLKSLSKLKSNIPLLNKSYIIYQVNYCSECKEFYIGLTTAPLAGCNKM